MANKQTEATSYIQNLIASRRIVVTPRKVGFEGDKEWVVFEHKDREIGIDPTSGVWIRAKDGNWTCLATLCNVSGALQAVEFLTQE